MGADLERLRQKVEAGERLTEAELRTLEDAARAQPGPTLRLALAHAWMNGDEDRRALALLETLARDFPRELQVRLGLARALIALERPSDAERALQEALRLSPHDPEALKALAAIALGRGEVRRARHYAAEALRQDPLDGEARLLKEELEATDLDSAALPARDRPPEVTALKDEFVSKLLERLTAAGMELLLHGRQLLLKVRGGGVARVDVGSLYSTYLDDGAPLEETLTTLTAELAALTLGIPEEPGALLARVLPVLRPGGFVDPSGLSVSREGPAGLRIFYVLEDPALVRYVPERTLGQLGLSFEELDRAAWENLELRPVPVQPVVIDSGQVRARVTPPGAGTPASELCAIAAGDGSDPARVLSRIQRERLAQRLPGPWCVWLGRRELAVLARLEDRRAVAELESLSPASDGITGTFTLSADGRLAQR